MDVVSKPKENSWLWLAKIITGGLVVVLILVHIIVNHTAVEWGLLFYGDVVVYFSHPWVVVIEISLLTIVVSYALLGPRSILLDIRLSDKVQTVIDRFLIIHGIVAIAYGFWLTQVIASRGTIG